MIVQSSMSTWLRYRPSARFQSPGGLRYSQMLLYLPGMTDFYEELVADLDAIGVEVEKAKMSRSEAGRAAANARWGNKGGGAPKMKPGGWRSAAGIPVGEQKSNARSKAGMQGARTRAQNKEAADSELERELERAKQIARNGDTPSRIATREKRAKAGAAARAAAEARFSAKLDQPKKTGMGPNALARQKAADKKKKPSKPAGGKIGALDRDYFWDGKAGTKPPAGYYTRPN